MDTDIFVDLIPAVCVTGDFDEPIDRKPIIDENTGMMMASSMDSNDLITSEGTKIKISEKVCGG